MRRDPQSVQMKGTEQADRSSQRNVLARAITGPLLFMFILGDVLGAGILLTQQRAATWLRAAALLAAGIVLHAFSRRTTKDTTNLSA